MHLQYLPKREKFDGNRFGYVNLAVCAQIVPTPLGTMKVLFGVRFTQGPAGKVNRSIVDSAGDCVVFPCLRIWHV